MSLCDVIIPQQFVNIVYEQPVEPYIEGRHGISHTSLNQLVFEAHTVTTLHTLHVVPLALTSGTTGSTKWHHAFNRGVISTLTSGKCHAHV